MCVGGVLPRRLLSNLDNDYTQYRHMNRVKWCQTEFTSLSHSGESFLEKERENAKEQFLKLLMTST